jgi:hypothetical protein
MGDRYHDARCPSSGKRVPFVTCGQDKVTGLSMSQTSAIRNTNWTTPEHRKGGCFKSSNGTFANMVSSTPSVWKPKEGQTNSRRRCGRGTRRRAKTVFRGKKIDPKMMRKHDAIDMITMNMGEVIDVLEQSRSAREGSVQRTDLWNKYRTLRVTFCRIHPDAVGRLDRLERIVRAGGVPDIYRPNGVQVARDLNQWRRDRDSRPGQHKAEPCQTYATTGTSGGKSDPEAFAFYGGLADGCGLPVKLA